ncbi:MAG: DUF1587 domain-containing protein, partial [Polaribacter sp.]|nr:DUF1587 domain-containing protein [Polaribacter sp.]
MIRFSRWKQFVISSALLMPLLCWQIGFSANSFNAPEIGGRSGGSFRAHPDDSPGLRKADDTLRKQTDESASINSGSTDEEFNRLIVPFLKQHCYQCHSAEEREADRRFDLLEFPLADENALIEFQDVLDQLNLGEMPPSSQPQPDVAEATKVIRWLTVEISKFQNLRKGTGGETVLRRLNRREYVNTVSDLLHLNTNSFDPTVGFPADQKIDHLDNQGHALVTSGFLLDEYLEAADKIIEKALPGLVKPEIQEWRFAGGFQQGEFTGFVTD